jgi:excisionase family DNA binding protein
MPTKPKPKRKPCGAGQHPPRFGDVLDVHATAALLMVSSDTVYDYFAKGDIPARKVGRKWITTKAAVLRWLEDTSGPETLARAAKRGDKKAITDALKRGKLRFGPKG